MRAEECEDEKSGNAEKSGNEEEKSGNAEKSGNEEEKSGVDERSLYADDQGDENLDDDIIERGLAYLAGGEELRGDLLAELGAIDRRRAQIMEILKRLPGGLMGAGNAPVATDSKPAVTPIDFVARAQAAGSSGQPNFRLGGPSLKDVVFAGMEVGKRMSYREILENLSHRVSEKQIHGALHKLVVARKIGRAGPRGARRYWKFPSGKVIQPAKS